MKSSTFFFSSDVNFLNITYHPHILILSPTVIIFNSFSQKNNKLYLISLFSIDIREKKVYNESIVIYTNGGRTQ